MSWGGTLQNKTPDHVTAWMRLAVSICDADGTEKEFSADTPIWIAPLDEAEFSLELPDLDREQLDNIKFCDHDNLAPTSCMT